MVLQVIRKYQMYAKLSKCSFYQNQIHYFGHIISEDGITVYPEKIESIREWSVPKNVTKFISFMGLVGYYIRFITGFSRIAHSHHFLAKKRSEISMDNRM
jgi:hypothetical protein